MPTVKELKDNLDDAGVDYDSKAKKDELEELQPSENTDSALSLAVTALEQIADTSQGAHSDQVITSVPKAAKVAQDALDRINDGS
jgi:hypothetical protein